MDAIASQLLTDVLQKTASPNGQFLTATDVYRIGLVIYNLGSQRNDQQSQANHIMIMHTVQTAALAVLQGFPDNFRQGLFDDLHEALQQVILVQQQKDTAHHDQEHLTRALESFIGIWSLPRVVSTSDKQQTARRRLEQRWPNQVEISHCFIKLYSKPHVPKACQSLILEFLSLVWLSPTIHKDNSNKNRSASSSSSEHLEEFLTVLHSLQEQDTLWQDLIEYHEQQQQSSSWRQELVQSWTQHSENDDATQRDYLSSLLQYEKAPETRSIAVPPSTAKPASKRVVVQNTAKKDAMQERIDQVRAVIPNLGEGFVELALSLYQGDAERAISALLEPDLPPGLQYVDRHLPRRKNPNAMAMNEQDALVAKQVTKKALQAEEDRQKAEAAALYYVSKTEEEGNMKHDVYHQHDEYDDEYDDQWDADFAGTTVGADDGLYDRADDYHAILAYNRAMKQVEGEQSFWDEQRNTNRKQSSSNAATADGGGVTSSYRGPDKIKGGRVPGAGRDGGGGDVAGGRGGRGGNKGAKGKKDSDAAQDVPAADGKGKHQGKAGASAASTTTSNNNNDNKPSKPNQRHKANKLASRREQQKQSMTKRSGGM